ncbi:MAG TPA: TonB-dependent receptor, partial [Flavisolibacter sp.]|jgi:hypothetical protein
MTPITQSVLLYAGKTAGKLCVFMIIALFSFAPALAQQGALSGQVADGKGAPLAYATVALLKAEDTTLASSVISGKDGKFSLPAPQQGRYLLRFTAIGFTEQTTGIFEVTGAGFSRDFGAITMKEDAKAMREVSVTALRPTIVQKADRMIVNVEGSAMVAGSNAYDVLAKAPGVFIDPDGNIQLNGRPGVTVMLDGKLTYLSAADLRNLLQSMSAENIKNIEIITNPSSRFDAEGTSGILNINLKKNTRQGMNGSVNTGYTYNGKQHGYSGGATINHKSGRWNSFAILDMSRRVSGREATFTRIFYGTQNTTYFDQVATGNNYSQVLPSLRVGTDYSLNDRHSIGGMVNYTAVKGESDFLTDTYLGNAPKQPNEFIDADNYAISTFKNLTTNLHYVGKLDTLGSQFSTDLDYVKITNRRESDFFNHYTDLGTNQTTRDFLYTFIPSGYDIHSGKIDLVKMIGKGKMETGLKASKVVSDNDSRFFFNNNGLVPDPKRTNHFNYRENIYAAYLNYGNSLSKRVEFQAGLRVENTVSTGESYTTGQVNTRNYLDFFPSLFVQQKVSDNYGINYSYSRRLTRPNYGSLNPFRFYRDPYTWEQGNPQLRPQYTHFFSISQNIKKTYNITMSYQLNRDVMAELPILDVDSATTIYTTGNVDDGHNASLSAVAPFRITKGWDTYNTLVLSYNKLTINVNGMDIVNDRATYYVQSNHTFLLPLDFRMEMNVWYRGKAASGLYIVDPMWRMDIGFKKSFFKKKVDFSITGNDLFKGVRYRFATDINGNVNDFDQYFRWRSVGVSLRYNFSKGQKVDTKRRNTNVEEASRAN